MPIFSPNVSSIKCWNTKKERVVRISGNPRRVVRFCRRERTTALMLVQWVLQDLCSDTMLNFHYARLKHEVYFILVIYLNHKQMQLHNYNCCNNQDHKKKYHAQEHKKYPGKTLLNKGEKPNNPLLYSQEKILQP
jgi:hypothetical protein